MYTYVCMYVYPVASILATVIGYSMAETTITAVYSRQCAISYFLLGFLAHVITQVSRLGSGSLLLLGSLIYICR